jgi:tRNA(Ile)-lysidine synthase
MPFESLLPLLAEFPSRRKYLVGVSGGCDSMVLLHTLLERGYKQLVVCHLNHRLRGRASQADAKLVEKTAAQLGLKCRIESINVAAMAKERKLSVETAARQARQEFFGRCAAEERCRTLFLAHHADDQVETVLMNVMRGSGLHGLGGMRQVSEFTVPGRPQPLVLVRPLLENWRDDLRCIATEQGIAFRDDASNASSEHLRNRLRHQLIPEASRVMLRDVRPALLRLSISSQADDDFLQQAAAEFPMDGDLATAPLLLAAPAIQRRVVHGWLNHHGIGSVSFELVERVRALLPPTSQPAKCNLPGGKFARRRAGVLFLE